MNVVLSFNHVGKDKLVFIKVFLYGFFFNVPKHFWLKTSWIEFLPSKNLNFNFLINNDMLSVQVNNVSSVLH